MLLELWERLRGYEKWVETRATIEKSDVTETPYANRSGEIVGYTYDAGDVIAWIDSSGEKQYATFEVEEDSPLFQLVGGESVTIRYDPAHPDRFYYRDLLRSQVRSGVKSTLAALALVAFVTLLIWARTH